MPTTGIMNATKMGVYVASTLITHSTEGTLTFTGDTRDITTKDSSGNRELLESTMSWSMSCNAMYADDATYGINALVTAFQTRAAVAVKFSTEVTGDDYWSGNAFITSLEMSGSVEDNVTFSVTLEGTGAITMAQVA